MATKLQRLIRRPATERGFTLIELLVVIIILGILAAVVVFAVSGVGDKGKSAATVIDERTIKTAEEAYCAKNGTYASGQQLVTGGFLSDLPKLHQVNAQPNQDGPCNGWKYFILRTAQANPYPAGKWDFTATAPQLGNTNYIVRLPDGKVLAGGYSLDFLTTAAQVWNPSNDVWTFTDAPPIPAAAISNSNSAFVLTDDPTTPQSECKGPGVDNCDKVLVYGSYLFNPKVLPMTTGQWATAPNPGPSCNHCNGGNLNANYFQVMNKNGPCGTACGNVYIFGSNPTGTNNFDVFDPRTNIYSVVPLSGNPTANDAAIVGHSVQLSDGRVFICCSSAGFTAVFFNPMTNMFALDAAANAPGGYRRGSDPSPTPVLPDGRIFFGLDQGALPRSTGLYTPQPGGSGTWKKVASCIPAGTTQTRNCLILGSLPDGRILSIFSANDSSAGSSHQIWVYNPATETWSQNPTRLNNRLSYGADALLLDPAGGPCGSYCNKMLVAGSASAEVYTP